MFTLTLTEDQLKNVLPEIRKNIESQNNVVKTLLTVHSELTLKRASSSDLLSRFIMEEEITSIEKAITTIKKYC